MCYINLSLDYKLKGHIGDSSKDFNLTLFSDADFAGCLDTAKSTPGVFIVLTGPNSFFPLNATSKKQSCVSHSTPEAEIVAADLAIRTEGLPALQLWDMVLERPMKLVFQEDNQAIIQILKTQNNPTLRHLNRTHRVNISWLCEVFQNLTEVELKYCKTDEMAAGIFTKAFTSPIKWNAALELIGIIHMQPSLASQLARPLGSAVPCPTLCRAHSNLHHRYLVNKVLVTKVLKEHEFNWRCSANSY